MIDIKHIAAQTCETCSAPAIDEAATVHVGIRHERRTFACGRTLRWSEVASKSWDSPCPKHPDEIRKRESRIRAIKTLLSTLTKLELPADEGAYLAERIKSTWHDIKDSDLR